MPLWDAATGATAALNALEVARELTYRRLHVLCSNSLCRVTFKQAVAILLNIKGELNRISHWNSLKECAIKFLGKATSLGIPNLTEHCAMDFVQYIVCKGYLVLQPWAPHKKSVAQFHLQMTPKGIDALKEHDALRLHFFEL